MGWVVPGTRKRARNAFHHVFEKFYGLHFLFLVPFFFGRPGVSPNSGFGTFSTYGSRISPHVTYNYEILENPDLARDFGASGKWAGWFPGPKNVLEMRFIMGLENSTVYIFYFLSHFFSGRSGISANSGFC